MNFNGSSLLSFRMPLILKEVDLKHAKKFLSLMMVALRTRYKDSTIKYIRCKS